MSLGCCQEFVAGLRYSDRTRDWKGSEASQIWMFYSQCRTISEVCKQRHGQLSLQRRIIIGCWQACKVFVYFNRIGIF